MMTTKKSNRKALNIFFVSVISSSLLFLTSCETVKLIAEVVADSPIIKEVSPMTALIADSVRSVGNAVEEFSPENEYYIGRGVAGSILSYYKLADCPDMNRYLTTLANGIAFNSGSAPQPYKGYYVAVLESDEINAFATSGGHIFVTSGFIKLMENEDQLAAVLAHEISHVQLRHGLGAIQNSRTWDAIKSVSKAGFVVYKEIDGGKGEETARTINAYSDCIDVYTDTLVNSGYSQDAEYDADNHALILLHSTGYNAKEMISMLELINTPSRNTKSGFGKTHPEASDRIKECRTTLKKMNPYSTDSARTQRFQQHMIIFNGQ